MLKKIFPQKINTFCADDICKADFIPWRMLNAKTFFITGATGLIGSGLIKSLLHANKVFDLNLEIIALVRDIDKAKTKFTFDMCPSLSLVQGTVESLPAITQDINYIIHCASQTSSEDFVKYPVQIISNSLIGTINLLHLAKRKNIDSFAYLSSEEVYGCSKKGTLLTENMIGSFSPFDLRNSYPISKQVCEALCYAYNKEYNIPTKIVRLSSVLGFDNDNDHRLNADILRAIRDKKDITLRTKNTSERCYISLIDAITAILTILVKGNNGEAYNVADETTYCSVQNFVENIAMHFNIGFTYNIDNNIANIFQKTFYHYLDTKKIRNLGWWTIC